VYPSAANWLSVVFVSLLPQKFVIKMHRIVKAKKLPW
jgi:hypothetical protein